MTQFTEAMDRLSSQFAKAHANVGGRIGSSPSLAKALTEPNSDVDVGGTTMSAAEFMDKAMAAVKRGHITTIQLTESEMRLNNKRPPDRQVIKAVLTETAYSPFG